MNVDIQPIPTGGAITLNFDPKGTGISTATGTLTIARANAATPTVLTTLYTGAANDCLIYLDSNSGQPGPGLPSGQSFIYQLTDDLGTETTEAIPVVNALIVVPNSKTALILRLLDAGLQNVVLPPGNQITKRPTMMTAMPLVGMPAMPLVVINEDSYQQETIPIGQQATQQLPDNTFITPAYMRVMWRVSIIATNPIERNFWKDALIAIYTSLLKSVFSLIGSNYSHEINSASFQVQNDSANEQPGYYGADVMMTVTGSANVVIQTFYGDITNIDFKGYFPSGGYQEAIVPVEPVPDEEG